MKKVTLLFLSLFLTTIAFSQSGEKAKSLLDEVSTKMGAYKNMYIGFSQTLSNKDAGIKEGDEPPIRGEINLEGEKYILNYLGNQFIYDGKKLYVINHDEKEISITDGDLGGDDGFIYPSKLLTFYKEGYNFKMGKLENNQGRQIQYVTLNPIDSNSDIVKVELGIDAKTKHIFNLIQTGSNGSKTTFTITKFKKNEELSENFFKFNKAKFLSQNYTID
ncbi:outer membrane lipoprotein carrier protein LolA [Polaribacter aestuariivivens]|uniref:Outer membrane lipoprotein carrier protein LolA n=1 Tax=Polaribacter aestuariivivens TaxID=2304626 RepID=A0A5S3N6V2_9FLAO|nr:outer membrane lipoprotein carrier protein LolA [Polaribacter aestuariivivens]TMM31025.1 outer membrane lipoprotein carrier protein LolA [Polaribacter aestuariivivens]